jgi:hypothetical protein
MQTMFSNEPGTGQKGTSAVGYRRVKYDGLGMKSKAGSRRCAYEICYLSADNRLLCKFVVQCRNATCAKIMAHAMKLPTYKRIEIWQGATSIYSRPLRY